MIEIVFAIGIIGLAILYVIEIYTVRAYNKSQQMWEDNVSEFIDGFNEMKNVINHNANIVRIAQEQVNKQDQLLKVYTIVLDIHSEALKIDRNIRKQLEQKVMDEVVQGIIDDD